MQNWSQDESHLAMCVAKQARLDNPDSPGANEGNVATLDLPPELWQRVAKFWPGNYEIEWVLAMRLMCRAFAQKLYYRVLTHVHNPRRFIDELRLLRTFNVRRTVEGGKRYAHAMNMVFRRMYERTKRNSQQWEDARLQYHHALLRYMENQGQLMPPEFDGFVARLHNVWANNTWKAANQSLENQFKRIRGGMRTTDGIVSIIGSP